MHNYLFKFVSSDCGSGKTYKLIQKTKASTEKVIIVQGTQKLCNQTYNDFADPIMVKLIISDEVQNVYDSVVDFLLNPSHRVLILCDVTFLQIKDISLLKSWKIYLDDVVSFHKFKNVNTEQKELVEKHLFHSYEGVSDNHVTAKPVTDFDDEVVAGAAGVFKFVKQYDYFLFNAGFFEKIGATDQYKRTKDQLQVMSWVNLNRFSSLDITFMAHDFENTLMFLSSPESFEATTLSGLRSRSKPVEQRMRVHYFSDVPLTRSLRDNSPEQFEKVLTWVNANVPKYIFTLNSDQSKDALNGTYITPKSRGDNEYQDYNAAVWLASMKPSNIEVKQVELMFKINRHQITQAREYEELYQFVQRTALRNFESDEEVDVYVFDKQQALSLSNNPFFIDLGIEVTNSVKVGSTFEPLHMTNSEKQAYKRIKNFTTKGSFDSWMNKKSQLSMSNRVREHFYSKWFSHQ
ncbi:Uncharacterised protein [Yersinia rohdei]|uniref:Uncharacterized protein n=1 Tax=Yersinia rohdei TaxID=29485 RepID=A0A0U1HUT7_YERRO|nr:hypothetical protein [Yersinia rohdei]CQI92615.1 Uncharacterised protein [Yersinia rohdei]